MAWQTPKTDWKIQPLDEYGRYNGDWFNWQDYERIIGNIGYVSEQFYVPIQKMYTTDEIVEQYPVYTGWESGGTITDQMRYAAPVIVDLQINPIEQNLNILANWIYKPSDFPITKTWLQNGATPTFSDLNRWEQWTLYFKNMMERIKQYANKLPFNMNGRRF